MPLSTKYRPVLQVLAAILASLAIGHSSVWAQGMTGPPRAPALGAVTAQPTTPTPDQPIQGATDPVVGSVEGHLLYLSELGRAAQTLPEALRNMPFETLYPVLLDRMIDHQAVVMMARRKGLEDNPQVKRDIQAAIERILEGALLSEEAAPKITEQAIQARYNRQYVNRPARKVIDDLQKGADFATLAKLVSKDPDASKGGDIGFFRREQVWPGFADVAFALQPGQVSPNPIRNEFGWHVIKVEERRLVAPPSYSDVHDTLRQEIIGQAVQQTIDQARAQMVIHKFNLDGSEMQAGAQLGSQPTQVTR